MTAHSKFQGFALVVVERLEKSPIACVAGGDFWYLARPQEKFDDMQPFALVRLNIEHMGEAECRATADLLEAMAAQLREKFDVGNPFPPVVPSQKPVPMRLLCPDCFELHIDEGEFAEKPHHTHACQKCGEVWRPAVVPTVGVRFLPGFKNEP